MDRIQHVNDLKPPLPIDGNRPMLSHDSFMPEPNASDDLPFTITAELRERQRKWLPNPLRDLQTRRSRHIPLLQLHGSHTQGGFSLLANNNDLHWLGLMRNWTKQTVDSHLLVGVWNQADLQQPLGVRETPGKHAHYPKCALVGPSGRLLREDFAHEIDQTHHIVARLNMHAPTFHYDVPEKAGSKSDVRFGNGAMLVEQWSASNFDHYSDSIAAASGVFQLYKWTDQELEATERAWTYWNASHHPPNSYGLRAKEPVFGIWSLSFRAWAETQLSDFCDVTPPRRVPPSTGMLAALTLLFTCSSLDIYGFGMMDQRDCRYYWEPCNAKKATQLAYAAYLTNKRMSGHIWKCEEEFLQKLANVSQSSVRVRRED